MDTLQGNKIIAEFMGYKYLPHPAKDSGWRKEKKHLKIQGYYLCRNHKQLPYRNSWDYLIPVVKKINCICHDNGFELSNHSRDQEHLENPLDNPLHWKSWSYHTITLSTDRDKVWNSVCLFIEWYNSHTRNNA